jgi:hypothetical protein
MHLGLFCIWKAAVQKSAFQQPSSYVWCQPSETAVGLNRTERIRSNLTQGTLLLPYGQTG